MSVLNFDQIKQLWIQYGGDPQWADTMAGIALAESGGNTTVINDNPATKDYSVGLFQINYFGDLLQGRTASYGSPTQLQNSIEAQVRAANNLLAGGSGISAWQGDIVGNYAQSGQPLTASQVQSALASSPQTSSYASQVTGGGGNFQPGSTGSTPGVPTQQQQNAAAFIPYTGPGAYDGFDLNAIPAPDRAQAEQAIQQYLGSPAKQAQVEGEIQQLYGFTSWLFDIPSVKTILIVGTLDHWSHDAIFGAIQQTQWWQTHDANQRYWAELSSDPATKQEALNEARAAIQRTAATIGLPSNYFSGAELTAMAEVVASNSIGSTGTVPDTGFTQDQITRMVASAYTYKANQTPSGDIATLTDNYKKLAGEFLIPQSDQAIGKAVQNAVQGDYNQLSFTTGATSAYENMLRTQAEIQYPYMKEQLNAGITPNQWADSYRQVAGQTLEVNPYQVDMTGKFGFALNQVNDKGQKVPMSLADFRRELMSNPKYGYQYTDVANKQAWTEGSQILDALGAVPAPVGF